MEKKPVLAQSNVITQSRYDFSVVEKRAVYFIIQQVRKQFIESPDGQRTLFDNLVVTLKTENLSNCESRLEDIYIALARLRKKSIIINNETEYLEVGYINYVHHKKYEPEIEIEVSKKILPHLVELAREFTSYYLTVAISLKNKYSQRFYEFCSQYRQIGSFRLTVDEIKNKFKIEDKYVRYAAFKSYVLDPAMKELKELYDAGQADVCFTYSELKAGRTTKEIEFFIKWTEREKQRAAQELKLEDMVYFIRTWLSSWLMIEKRPKNKDWVDKVIKSLQLNPDKFPECYEKLVWIQKNKPQTDWAPYARFVIEEEYIEE